MLREKREGWQQVPGQRVFWTASFEYHHGLPIDGAKGRQANFAREACHNV